MKVRAINPGFYGNIRIKVGQAFRLLDSKHFSKVWMVALNKNAKVEDLAVEPAKVESVLIDEEEEKKGSTNSNSEVI